MIIKLLLLREKRFPAFFDSTPKKKEQCFINRLHSALYSQITTHLCEGENSIYYIDQFNVDGNRTTLTLRVSDHNANAANFKKDGSEYGYSVVGKESKNKSGKLTDSTECKVREFTYVNPTDATYRNIINRIIVFLLTGEYSDPTADVAQTSACGGKQPPKVITDEEAKEQEYKDAEEMANKLFDEARKPMNKKKGLSGTPTEPTDIKEMFDRLPIEGKDVRNIRYRTEDILVYADEADFMDTPRSWVILARKLKGFEAFIEKIESPNIVYRTYSPVYNSKEWWSCSYSDYYSLKGILYLVHIYNETCAGASRNSLRVIFESPGQCMMFTQNGVEYLYTSKAYMFKGCGGFTWDLSRGIWVDKWHHHRPLMLKAMKRDFPDGKFVDRLIDEKPGPFAELLYDSSRFSLLCNKDHNFAWYFRKEIPKSYSFNRKEDVKGIAREVCKEMGLDIDSNRFIEYTPNDINRAIAIIEKGLREKRFPRGKRYGIAADFAKAAQARARATKTAAKAKIKIARKKRA